MNEKWRFCNTVSSKNSMNKGAIDSNRSFYADDAAFMKAYLRIDFLYNRVRSIWLGCYLGTKEPKRVSSQRPKPCTSWPGAYQLTRRQLRLRQLHLHFTIHIQDYPVGRLHPSLTILACEMHLHHSTRVYESGELGYY